MLLHSYLIGVTVVYCHYIMVKGFVLCLLSIDLNIGKSTLISFDKPKVELDAHFIISTIFVSNFIGIAFARSLHYQFYCWYFHTLPYLLFAQATVLPIWAKLGVMVGIELAFNVFPATWWSSAVLQVIYLQRCLIMVHCWHAQCACTIYRCPTWC